MLQHSRSKVIFISLVALTITFILARDEWLTFIGRFLVVQDTLEPADVIHVIAGDDYRTDYAFQLYQQGYGKRSSLQEDGVISIFMTTERVQRKRRLLKDCL